jgi:putative ABC transport system permease protein
MFLLGEAFRFAVSALRVNGLRTLLSLLGMTVGIFAIVMVFTAVDSLKREIRTSLSFLGENVIYVQKWPWNFKPGFAWWRYLNRPAMTEQDFRYLEREAKEARGIALVAWREDREVKGGSRIYPKTNLRGVTYGYNQVAKATVVQGRYFTEAETRSGASVCIIGAEMAEKLFPGLSVIGRDITYKGLMFRVIGLMKREGKTLIGTPSSDGTMLIPYTIFKKVQKVGKGGVDPMVMMKGRADDPGLASLTEEVKWLMRGRRNLRPSQDDNFAINRPEMITNSVDAIFAVVGIAGGIIASFSILVGAFGIANIMFVSVRERQGQIGIQKALGARRSFILWQFLFEAVLLSIAGGILGIGLVWAMTFVPQDALRLELTLANIQTGVAVSVVVGLLAGTIPALVAAKLDPVEAIRG